MKNIHDHIKMKNKRGQTVELVTGTVLALMVLFFLVFAVLFGISALNPKSFFGGTDPYSSNATVAFQQNLTKGIMDFGGKIPTVFLILGVVLAISAIVILVLYVKRMKDTGGSGQAGL